MSIALIDTSIFLNLLDVPGRNQDYQQVLHDVAEYIELEFELILPLATVVETGNHIAQCGDGGTRRKAAQRFRLSVEGAFNGQAPWQASEFDSPEQILTWLPEFPDMAGRNKSTTKPNEGTSFGDLSIIQKFKRACARHKAREVFIWSLDEDLQSYHHIPTLKAR